MGVLSQEGFPFFVRKDILSLKLACNVGGDVHEEMTLLAVYLI